MNTKFARIVGGVAIDISFNPQNEFHPDIAAEFVAVPNDVVAGSRKTATGWDAPHSEEIEEVVAYKEIGPIAFKLLFTSQERVAAKSARADDPVLDDFWSLIDDPRTDVVNLSLSSVQDAIEYTLAKAKAAGVDVDVVARKAEILTGILN